MEAAKIDWSSIESVFVIDDSYEDINAPQWVDFFSSSPPPSHHHHHVDDDWFCRPECKHPKTADDFLKPNLLRSVSSIGLTHRRSSNREPLLKNVHEHEEDDSENQNPNYSPEPMNKNGGLKDTRSQSSKDLFGGGDILAKITDLCSELKKMASLTRTKDTTTTTAQDPPLKTKLLPPPPPTSSSRSKQRPVLGERPDLLKMTPSNPTKSAQKNEDIENVPKSLNLKNMKVNQQQEGLLPIRTNPPTPQGFSATRATTSSTTPSKGPKSRLLNQKKEILKEVEQDGTFRAELGDKCHTPNESVVAGKQGRALDVLWFLKPCTL